MDEPLKITRAFPASEERYEAGRSIEHSPFGLASIRVATHLSSYYGSSSLEPLFDRQMRLKLDRVQEKASYPFALLTGEKSELELQCEEVVLFIEELLKTHEELTPTYPFKEFLAEHHELIRRFNSERRKVTWLKRLLQEHFLANVSYIHDIFSQLATLRARFNFQNEPFYELARLRDSLFASWTEATYSEYLEKVDALKAMEDYPSWVAQAEIEFRYFDQEPPSDEEKDALLSELEAAHIWWLTMERDC